MSDFQDHVTLCVYETTYPDEMLDEVKAEADEHTVILRWDDLFRLVPSSKEIHWSKKIDAPEEEFYQSVGLHIVPDHVVGEAFEKIVADSEHICMHWSDFIGFVPDAGRYDWSQHLNHR
ncbi:hypothetical protein GF324_05625 [bacterium]|nr:hypothetical protein [bacterium]